MTSGRVLLLSLEPWDEVWRRNQHLATELVRQKLVTDVVFVEPPQRHPAKAFSPQEGIRVVRPRLTLPRRAGGLRLAAFALRVRELRRADLLWINDAGLGVHCLIGGRPAVYDVTDDWRTSRLVPRIRRRLVRAEDVLATRAHTIVCSTVLRDRWCERYDIRPPVVQNAADRAAFAAAVTRSLPGDGPHVGYVGTLHSERLDVDLVLELARDPRIGTVHLIGPDSLAESDRARLAAEPSVRRHGRVDASDVPGWMVSLDVVLSPHLVSSFTMSLDGIKAHEYLASGRAVVATPTSGFQLLVDEPLVVVVGRENFVDAVANAPADAIAPGTRGATWADRAAEFAAVLARSR